MNAAFFLENNWDCVNVISDSDLFQAARIFLIRFLMHLIVLRVFLSVFLLFGITLNFIFCYCYPHTGRRIQTHWSAFQGGPFKQFFDLRLDLQLFFCFVCFQKAKIFKIIFFNKKSFFLLRDSPPAFSFVKCKSIHLRCGYIKHIVSLTTLIIN